MFEYSKIRLDLSQQKIYVTITELKSNNGNATVPIPPYISTLRGQTALEISSWIHLTNRRKHQMTEQNYIDLVDELIKQSAETEWLEFKVGQLCPDVVGKLVSALSNSAGYRGEKSAFLIWGIEDASHKVVGTDFDPYIHKANGQPYELWITRALQPPLPLKFQSVEHPKGRVVILEIPAPTLVPVAFKGTSYIRIGNASTELHKYPLMHRALFERIISSSWESGVAARYLLPKDVLCLLDYVSYFRLLDRPMPEGRDDIMRNLAAEGLIELSLGGRWNILNLGAILFASNLEKFNFNIQTKAVRIARYYGQSRVGTTTEKRLSRKGYASDFKEILEFIIEKSPQRNKITDPHTEIDPLFPTTAIREIVSNALIHQDMTIDGPGPTINIFNDRIEIRNLGSLLVGSNRLIERLPRSRNPALVSLMRRMDMCEEEGGGMAKIFSDFENHKLPAPYIRPDQDGTKVEACGPRKFEKMNLEEKINTCYWHCVLGYEVDRKPMSEHSLCERFCVNPKGRTQQISNVIRDTLKSGKIKLCIEGDSESGYKPFWA